MLSHIDVEISVYSNRDPLILANPSAYAARMLQVTLLRVERLRLTVRIQRIVNFERMQRRK